MSGQRRLPFTLNKVSTHSNDSRSRSPTLVGESAPRSKQVPFPYTRDLTGEVIISAAMKLWKELHGTDNERAANPNTPNMKIINIAIAFTGIEALELGQRGIEGFLGSNVAGPSKVRPQEESITREKTPIESPVESLEYICPKCSKTITTPIQHHDGIEIRAAKLEAAKAEHEDYHFAQQLSRQDKLVIGGGGGKRRHSPGRTAPKKKKNNDGIMSYFQKK